MSQKPQQEFTANLMNPQHLGQQQSMNQMQQNQFPNMQMFQNMQGQNQFMGQGFNQQDQLQQQQMLQQQQQFQNMNFMQFNQSQSQPVQQSQQQQQNTLQKQNSVQNPQSTPNFLQTPNMYNSISQQTQNTSQQNSYMQQGSGSGNTVQIGQNFIQMDSNYNNEQNKGSQDEELNNIVKNILNLRNHDKREEALQELSKKRDSYPNLAPLLWHSVGTIAILIQDIVSIYHALYPPNLTPQNSSRVCSVLGLLQCLALHSDTKNYFLQAHIPLFLYPFLNTNQKSKAFENLRVTSLGVIGALVKGDDTDAITFLMQTEIIPLCLRIMKRGQELSRTVATFIVQKILLDDSGLSYICQTAERFFAVSTVLQSMIDDLHQSEKEDQRLLRHIIRCYLRLSENQRANEALMKCLPQFLRDPNSKLITDEVVKRWHASLLQNLKICDSNGNVIEQQE